MGNKFENKIHINVFNIFHVKFAKFYDFPKLNEKKKMYLYIIPLLAFVRSFLLLSIYPYICNIFFSFFLYYSLNTQPN